MERNHFPLELLFFADQQAESLFAKFDTALRDGVYIQLICDPSWWEFIRKYDTSLIAYYKKYWSLQLLNRGQGSESYFFLDFFADSGRGKLSGHYRQIDNSYLLVGFLLYRVKKLDRNIELRSIKEFKRLLREDYQELRPGINRMARSNRQNSNPNDNESINALVDGAFQLFNRIKWIKTQEDQFDELPAFQRLIDAYLPFIQNLDQYLKA